MDATPQLHQLEQLIELGPPINPPANIHHGGLDPSARPGGSLLSGLTAISANYGGIGMEDGAGTRGVVVVKSSGTTHSAHNQQVIGGFID